MRKMLVPVLMAIVLLVAYIPGCNVLQTENKPPIAVFSAEPPSINAGDTVHFSANESKDKDGKIVKFSWDFGDDAFALGPSTEHTYKEGGDFSVKLVIKDDSGAMDTANLTIHVNEWPVAQGRAGKDPAKVNEVIDFDASFSSDKDGDIVKYHWDFGDDRDAKGRTPSHKYSKVGTYSINLTVTDDKGATDVYMFKIVVVERHYKVLWEEGSKTIDTISGQTDENQTTNKTIDITMTNLTALEFNMTWNDHIPVVGAANDEFLFEVVSPEGDVKQYKATNEMITHTFKIDDLPETISMESESAEKVNEFISSTYTSTKGNGKWLLRITCLEAGDVSWVNNERFEQLDNGNDWDIEITGYYYASSIIETG